VVDTRTGRVLRSYEFASGETFVNDVVLTRRFAWFTDSLRARLYGLPLGRGGRLPRPSQVVTRSLSGQWAQTSGLNANGIARTPDGRALLVVQSSTGYLFRVDPRTGVARRVDLGDALLTNGDGLLNRGRVLFAVQNQLNRVAVLRLSRTGRVGRLVDTLSSSAFDVPTTVARFGRFLYLPNARFSTPPTPTTEYTAWSNAPGTVPTTVKPSDVHSATAAVLVSTTALKTMPRNPWARCQSTTWLPRARPTPRPWASGATMKLAVPMCAPRPSRFGPMVAVPSTTPSVSATTVDLGGVDSHMSQACAEVMPGS